MTFEYITPFLLAANILAWIFLKTGMDRIKCVFIAVPSALLVFFPIRGLSLSDLALSANPNFSAGSAAFLFIIFAQQATGRIVLKDMEILLFSIFNIALFFLVSGSALGFFGYDIYASGYRFSAWFLVVAAVTAGTILFNSALLLIFISYILSYDLRLLPSENFFDHATDGVMFLISVFFVIRYALRHLQKNKPMFFTSP